MAPPVRAYGLDYSARELSPREIDDFNKANPATPISFLVRYIGYPANRKCISAYPGALRAHESSGRAVALVHQVAYNDFLGGERAGIAHAKLSIADAERAGWQWNRPVFAAYDRFLAGNVAKGITPMTVDQVEDYVGGFRSVLGDLAGLYGFYDVMGPAVRGQWTKWFWQCGAESALVPGVQIYQWNNGRVFPGGMECDLNKSYVDISSFGGDDEMTPEDKAQLNQVEAYARETWEQVAQKIEGLSALHRHVNFLGDLMIALAKKVDTLEASGIPVSIDYSRLADEFDKRARDGDPNTGPVT